MTPRPFQLARSPFLFLAVVAFVPCGTSFAGDEPPIAGPVRNEGVLGRFMRDHGWRLLVAAGIDRGATIYSRSAGYSREPLLFEDPPGFDRAIRNTFSTGRESRTYLARYGVATLKYGTALALIGLDFGDRREMAADLFGAAEAFFMNRGLTHLIKNVAGRERPELEFADPNALGAAKLEELRTAPHSHESFPSGHASGSFMWASYMERVIARKAGMRSAARKISFAALYGAAGYIAYTRVRGDDHYFSDIVAGAALGTAVSRTFYRLEHPEEFGRHEPRPETRRSARIRLHPPQFFPGGVVVTAGLRLGADRP